LRLRPDLYFAYNPLMDGTYTLAMETQLADQLRLKGYAVWQH
jgi:hypothetical protein